MEVVQENKVTKFLENLPVPSTNSTIQKEALQALKGFDFPNSRVEDWKYTRTTRITNKSYEVEETKIDVTNYLLPSKDVHQLVFVNGFFDQEASVILDDEALEIASIFDVNEDLYAETVEDLEETVFSLINKGYTTGGASLTVRKNQKATYSVHLIHVVTGENVIANTRHFFNVEEGAALEVISSYYSLNAKDSFQNIVLDGNVASNAKLSVYKIQAEEKDMFHISSENFVQAASSSFYINTITLGGLLVRNGLNIIVEGENCYTELNGVYLGKDKQHLDNHTFVDHLYSNCVSSETYKGVMDDKSTGVFNGKVIVREDAQKIEAYQSNGNILLSDTATVNSKPELEIYADDVRCSHGSTTGQLDEEAVFYLRARGISASKARELLVVAFIGEVLEKIDNEQVRSLIDQLFLTHYNWEF